VTAPDRPLADDRPYGRLVGERTRAIRTQIAVGERLREIRTQKGLSLDQVEALSSGRFKVAALGTYERGDRNMSMERLTELAALYGVPVVELIPDAAPGIRQKPLAFNLPVLRALADSGGSEVAARLLRYALHVQQLRDDWSGKTLAIPASDYPVLAVALGIVLPAGAGPQPITRDMISHRLDLLGVLAW
jgi:transcriptional regulator with XRE-family HTH domain